MIEKVARAIAAAYSGNPNCDWTPFEKEARAAIKAMREPTKNMKHNAQPMYDDPCSVSDIWDTMIATALSEAPNAND